MSLAINIDRISGVLLADGWEDVEVGTFTLDAYELVERNDDGSSHMWHAGGAHGICSQGFRFECREGSGVIAGPLTSILAVRYFD